jgi:uncharacterized protein YndB with AHSA1/START domain
MEMKDEGSIVKKRKKTEKSAQKTQIPLKTPKTLKEHKSPKDTINEDIVIKKMKEPDLIITRIFDAPRDLVWKFWTEPERVRCWWGPKDFTVPTSIIDFRVGGKYLHCMRGPDGKDYWTTGEYREIIPSEIIVSTDNFADKQGNIVPASYYGMTGNWSYELLITVSFEDQNGKTKFTLVHEGIPAGELRDQTKAGWNQSFDKLADCLVLTQTEDCGCEKTDDGTKLVKRNKTGKRD